MRRIYGISRAKKQLGVFHKVSMPIASTTVLSIASILLTQYSREFYRSEMEKGPFIYLHAYLRSNAVNQSSAAIGLFLGDVRGGEVPLPN